MIQNPEAAAPQQNPPSDASLGTDDRSTLRSLRKPLRGARTLRQDTFAVILAGGRGARLETLTRRQCKPALSFGGQARNIDFALSNCVNSGIRRIGVLTQYLGHSLVRHIREGWGHFRPELGEFVELWPAQQRLGEHWYRGTADAMYQNIDEIRAHDPAHVVILAGDHVYKMDYSDMIEAHRHHGASVTIGCVAVPRDEAGNFGVLETEAGGWVSAFDEKPRAPAPMPGRPDRSLASMGIYVFDTAFLIECLEADANDARSAHDFGRNVLPAIIGGRSAVLGYRFTDQFGAPGYWRDVGSVDSYWRAHMDLLEDDPRIDLTDTDWPIWTRAIQAPPPRFAGRGVATNSIVSVGSIVAGEVRNSVISPGCRVMAGSLLEDAVVLPNARIGRNCRILRAIVDEGCVVPDGTVVGADLFSSQDWYVSPTGVVLYSDRQNPTPPRAAAKIA